MLDSLWQLINSPWVINLLMALLLSTVGWVLANLCARFTERIIREHYSKHHAVLFRRIVFWLILGLFAASALKQLGFSLGILLGAAGVMSVAIGFASQTSASNLISGLFLIGERPFQIGDVIRVGNTTGEVLSIDLLSVKLRTFDNLFVRLPNESLIKSEVTNLSRFPIRRFDLQIGVAYKEDIAKVREVLFAVAEKNPLSLEEPAPTFLFNGFGDSALNLQFSVWCTSANFRALRNSLQEEVKVAFDQAGIEIPFPHRTLYSGSDSAPFPVTIVSGASEQAAPATPHTPNKGEDNTGNVQHNRP